MQLSRRQISVWQMSLALDKDEAYICCLQHHDCGHVPALSSKAASINTGMILQTREQTQSPDHHTKGSEPPRFGLLMRCF